MENKLIITGVGVILCLTGSIVLARSVFKNEPPNTQLYIYTREENIQRQKLANRKYQRNRRIDIIGFILTTIGAICQILALSL